MICPKCNINNKSNANFCGNCGEKLANFETENKLKQPLSSKTNVTQKILLTKYPPANILYGIMTVTLVMKICIRII